MPWPEKFLRVIEGPAAINIGTRDARLRPTGATGSLMRTQGPDRVLIHVVDRQAARVLPNLRDNGAIAVNVSLSTSHEAYQLKGRVEAIEDAPAADEALIRAQTAKFLDGGAGMGLPRHLLESVHCWPAVVLTVQVSEMYVQTPGPRAGDPIAS
jgi:hypothetical protein